MSTIVATRVMPPESDADVGTDRGRIPELDGVRGVAIALVLFWHYSVGQLTAESPRLVQRIGHAASMTWTGVDLFFVLSGFLIGGILLDNRGAPNLYRTFYLRRSARIFPLYFAWLAGYAAIVWAGASRPAWLFDNRLPLWAYALYVQNFVMAARDAWGSTWMVVTWSLAVEEQFYLILPAAVALLPPRRLLPVLIVASLAAVVLRVALAHRMAAPMLAVYTLLPCRWDSLFAGVIGAWLLRAPRAAAFLRATPAALYAAAGVTGVVLVAAVLRPAGWVSARASCTFACAAGFYLAIILLAVTLPRGAAIRRLLRTVPLRLLGGIAYGVYMFHQAVAGLCHYLLLGHDKPQLATGRDAAVTMLSLAITIALAWASFRWFESPLLRLAHRVRYAPPALSR